MLLLRGVGLTIIINACTLKNTEGVLVLENPKNKTNAFIFLDCGVQKKLKN